MMKILLYILIIIITVSCFDKIPNDKIITFNKPFFMLTGTAQDGGYPQAGCERECCKSAWHNPALRRMVVSAAIIDPMGKKFWMIDATPDFKMQLQAVKNLQSKTGKLELAGIFVSHAHIGHYTGLMNLGREVMGAKKVKVYALERMKKFLETNGPWDQLVKLENIDIIKVESGIPVQLSDNIRITPVKVPHRDEYSETASYKIEGKNKKVLYISDIDNWHSWERDIIKEVEKVDYAFLDGTFYNAGELPGVDLSKIPHPFIELTMNMFKDKDFRNRIWFFHLNHTNRALNKNSKEYKTIIDNGFNVAFDFLKINL